ncbi:MAG: ATP-binding cassette domain-containing protein, partial [Ruminococcus sp.]|nr:ATP-binding cassette domain-containing protein [Ruminococcus sp.]
MILAHQLTKRFEDFTALRSLSCEIEKGCIYGMVGSNGAGKSTLLRVLSGIYKADKGEVIIDGINVYENTYMKNKLVFVADELFFLPGATMKSMAKFYSSIYD